MKNYKKILFGIVLLIAGVIIALNAFGVTDIDVWFPGWWTLFIIIPCGVGLFTERDKSGNLIGLLVGVVLLLWQLDIVDISILWKLLVPAVLIVIAIKLIVGGLGRKNDNPPIIITTNVPENTAIFGGRELNYDGQIFDGVELTTVFGGIECDLRGAIIEKDCVIKATSVFGGIDISVPSYVNVKVNSTNIFGETDDMTKKGNGDGVTLYVESVSIFGGVDIK
jgi:predicted membrane protein